MTLVDQTARDMAEKALMLLAGHERLCDERERNTVRWRGTISDKLDDLSISVIGLYNRVWIAAGGVIIVLIGCVGYLIAHHGL